MFPIKFYTPFIGKMKPGVPLFTGGLKKNIFETAQGITSYYDLGQQTNPVIVLVPGYLCSSLMYKDLALHLVDKGFRVVMYDPYGTGGSIKQDSEKYNIETFVAQLDSVVTNLSIRELSLVGYSMGGVIAGNFAKTHAGMVKRIVFISPAGVSLNLGPPSIIRIMSTPFIGPKYIDFFYDKMIMGAVKVNFVNPEDPKFAEIIQFLYMHIYTSWCTNTSFSQAACGIMRHFNFFGCENIFRSISTIPTTVILAKKDVCVGIEKNHEFWSSIEGVDLHELEECGHWAIHEKREEVFEIFDNAFC